MFIRLVLSFNLLSFLNCSSGSCARMISMQRFSSYKGCRISFRRGSRWCSFMKEISCGIVIFSVLDLQTKIIWYLFWFLCKNKFGFISFGFFVESKKKNCTHLIFFYLVSPWRFRLFELQKNIYDYAHMNRFYGRSDHNAFWAVPDHCFKGLNWS